VLAGGRQSPEGAEHGAACHRLYAGGDNIKKISLGINSNNQTLGEELVDVEGSAVQGTTNVVIECRGGGNRGIGGGGGGGLPSDGLTPIRLEFQGSDLSADGFVLLCFMLKSSAYSK
jgi:hypothetical protein